MRCGCIGSYRYKNTVFFVGSRDGTRKGKYVLKCRKLRHFPQKVRTFLHDKIEGRAGLEIYRSGAAGYNEIDPRKNGHHRDGGRM